MMARLVALMDSIRATVRRVTDTPATPTKHEHQCDAQGERRVDLLHELIEVLDVLSHQQMGAVRERLEGGSQHGGPPHPAARPAH